MPPNSHKRDVNYTILYILDNCHEVKIVCLRPDLISICYITDMITVFNIMFNLSFNPQIFKNKPFKLMTYLLLNFNYLDYCEFSSISKIII